MGSRSTEKEQRKHFDQGTETLSTAPGNSHSSTMPIVGDPLCAVAGWLKLPFWPCIGYMAIGKFGRYLVMSGLLFWVFPGKFTP